MWEIWELCINIIILFEAKCLGTTVFSEDFLDAKTLILYFKINSGKVFLFFTNYN